MSSLAVENNFWTIQKVRTDFHNAVGGASVT